MTFSWWLVAILTCKSFVTFRSARFPQENWSGTSLSDIANDWRNRWHNVLDLLSNLTWVRSKGCFWRTSLGSSDNPTWAILVSRTDDDPSLPSSPLLPSPPPCVHSTRPRVCVQNVPVCTGNIPTCFIHVGMLSVHTGTFWTHTRGRVECTHGDFQRATPQQTQHHTHNTHTHKHTHTHTHTHTPTRTHQHAHTNTHTTRTQRTPHYATHCTHARHSHLTHHTPRHKPHTTHDTTTRTHTHTNTHLQHTRTTTQEVQTLNCLINCPPSGN